jgi:hypothetical protein
VAGPCVELYQASAAFHDLANLRTLLGIAALLQGDHPALYALFRQEAADGHLDRFDQQVSDWLWLVAAAAATDGDVQCAARLLGALESTGSRIEETMLAHYHDALAQRLSEARRRSSEPAWQSVWQEGQSMTLHQAVICALRRSNLGQSPGRGVQ